MPGQITVGGVDVVEMILDIPRAGAWTADLNLDSDTALTGSQTINVNDSELTLSGTVFRGGVFELTNTVRMVGGKAGLSKNASPKGYENSPTVQTILSDLMSDAGESLSSSSTSSVVNASLSRWTTIQQPVCRMMYALMDSLSADAVFRVLSDGTVFVGTDSYPDFAGDFDLLDQRDYDGTMDIGLFAPTLQPGVTLSGKKISYVQHHITGEKSTTKVWYE